MSDETDLEIARLRDELRQRLGSIEKLQMLCADYVSTIQHLVGRERDLEKQLADLRSSLIPMPGDN